MRISQLSIKLHVLRTGEGQKKVLIKQYDVVVADVFVLKYYLQTLENPIDQWY